MKLHKGLIWLALIALLLGAVSVATAAPPPQKPTPPAVTGIAATAPKGIESLSGSFVVFDPSVGGDTCFTPGASQTFCFRAESFTNDWEYVYNLWQRFPADWTVNNVYVQGTPSCTGGGTWGSFSWSFQTSPYEVNIAHPRNQAYTDHCTAYYCFDVTSGTGTPDALESWYWDGDGYGSPPHNPCSSDGYTPAGQNACDEATQPQAAIPPCALPPIMLTPPEIDVMGCPWQPQEHTLTVWNNAGYDTNVDLTYTVITGTGVCGGPAQLFLANGTNMTFTVGFEPQGAPGDTVVCQVYAEDASNPNNNDTSLLIKHLVDAITYWEQIATEPDNGRMDNVLAGYNGLIWSITGYGANANVRTYDPGSDAWSTVAGSAPPFGVNYARSGCHPYGSAAANKVFVYGDAATAGFTGLWSYNMDTNVWTNESPSGTPPPQTGIWAPAWAYDPEAHLCYMTGGSTTPGGGNLTTVYVYDPVANAWLAPLPNFTTARDFHAAFVMNGMLCVMGGVDASNVVHSSTQCYNGTAWNAENADIPALPMGWWAMGYADKWHAGTDQQLWLVNGADAAFALIPNTYYYDVNAGQWVEFGPLASGTFYRTAAVNLDGDIYHIGGSTGGFTYSGLSDHHVQIICPPPPSFQAWKEAPAEAAPGQVISYTIVISAPALVDGMSMTDPLPPGVAYAGNLTFTEGYAWYSPTVNTVFWEYHTKAAGTPASVAQPAEDLTLGRPVPLMPAPAPLTSPPAEVQAGASPEAILDDFNRADGPIGPNWTVHDGFCNVSSNAAVCGSMGRATFNNYVGDGNVAEADVENVGTALQYTGLLLNYGAGSSNLFLKVQNQSGGNQFGHAGCYTGNNGGPFGLGFFALSSPFTTAHMRATRVGNDVTIEFTNIDGGTQPDQTYVCSGAPAPEGTGIGILGYAGIARLDNFGVPGGGPSQAAITFDVTVTAGCGEVIHNQGWATDGTTVVDLSADTLVAGPPDIAADPPALWDMLCPDTTDTMTMTICNEGCDPLVWELHEYTPTLLAGSMPFVPVQVEGAGVNPGLTAASPQVRPVAVPAANPEAVLWDQPLSSVNQNAYVDQEFTDYPDYSSFLADDFVNADPWAISAIFVPGNGWNGFASLFAFDALTWQIYADDGTGFPDGDPHGGGNPPVWTLTLPPNDPAVVITNGSGGMPSNTQLNLATPLVLPPGHWWLVFYPTGAFGSVGQYGRQPADTANGYVGKFINPGGGFGMGTDWQDWTVLGVTQPDIAFRLEGEIVTVTYPDYPWLSESPITGTVPPGECAVVDVTFDSTGLAPGDYFADLLILSNDPDEPEVTVPVTMTVLEPAAIVDVVFGIDGLTVAFTSTVSGSAPIDYLWDFGDGVGSSTGPNPTYTYAEGGCYTVTLTVSNECGQDTWSEQVCVCEPVHDVDFTWLPANPPVGEVVTFTGTAQGTEPIGFDWDLGDGTLVSGMVVTHVYTATGDYVVTLMATNCDGDYDVVTHTVTVVEVVPPHHYYYLPIITKNF